MTESTICVGVDGSTSSRAALQFACAEAKYRGAKILAVTAWWIDVGYGGYGLWPSSEDQAAYKHSAAETQARAIERVAKEIDEMPEIDRRVVRSAPGEALVELARDCDLLVVGTEHKGLMKRVSAGSTSTYCVRHSHTPVVVVPLVDTDTHGLDTSDT